MEKYSVLMSVYVKEKPEFLRLSLDSMVNQSVPPDQIVLVEDGPLTDELYKAVDEYTAKYPDLFKIVVNEKNIGLGLSLRKGLAECENDLVARMDTDDIAFPDRCEKQLAYFESHPSLSVLGGQIEEFETDPSLVISKRVVPLSDSEIKEFMKNRNPLNHMTVMLRKPDVLSAGSYRDRMWYEDYDLWIRLAINDYELANLPDALVHARIGEGMYERRGGIKYFKAQTGLQKMMLDNNMISFPRFCYNYVQRFIIAGLLPGKVRGWVYRKFARK